MALRPLSLAQACQRHTQRYTLDHVPQWASYPLRRDRLGAPVDYPAPQFASDEEWYALTTFPGENGLSPASNWCISSRQTWPLGTQTIDHPYVVFHVEPRPNPDRKPVTRDASEERSHDNKPKA